MASYQGSAKIDPAISDAISANIPSYNTRCAVILSRLTDLDNLILLGILITLFFMPLHEKLKATGFWITLAFWLTKLVIERKELRIWIPPLGWALLLFVGAAFLSAIFSDYHNRATRGALDALRNTLIFLILANTLNSYKQIKYVILALMGGIVIGDFAAIHKYFSIGPEIEMLSLGEKNSTAQVLSMFLALLLGLLFTLCREYLFRVGLFIMIGLTGFVLVLTNARGIWVAFVFMMVIFGLIQRDWKILVAFIFLTSAVLVGMSYSKRITQEVTTLRNPLTETNMISRYEIWKQSMKIVQDRPLFGIGLKTYGLPQVTEKYNLQSSSHAHNMFVNVTSELGITGLAVLGLWLILYLQALFWMHALIKSDYNQGLWLGGLGSFVILLIGGIVHPFLGSESSLTLMTILGLMHAGFRIENGQSCMILNYLYKIPSEGFRLSCKEFKKRDRIGT